jgi:hypothetical protein
MATFGYSALKAASVAQKEKGQSLNKFLMNIM